MALSFLNKKARLFGMSGFIAVSLYSSGVAGTSLQRQLHKQGNGVRRTRGPSFDTV
jgi:hypothetical protein